MKLDKNKINICYPIYDLIFTIDHI